MIYYQIYLFLSLLAICASVAKKSQRELSLYLGAAVILLFQALRWKTGTDWNPYLNEFLNVNKPGLVDEFEPGYVFLNSIIRHLTDNYTVFLFVECGLNLFFTIFFLKKMPITNKPIGLLYFFAIAVFPIRFTLASNMILCSYVYILEKKIISFCVIVIGASLIHRTAISFLPMYFICQYKFSFKVLMIIYIGAIILGTLAEYTFGNLLQVASMAYGLTGSTVQSKMEAYVTGEIPERLALTPIRYLMSIANSTLFIFVFYYFKRTKFSSNTTYTLLFTLYVLGISFNRIFLQTIPDFARMTSFFTGGFIIMIIMIISTFKRRTQVFATLALTFYIFLSYNSTINGFYKNLFNPYYSIFTDNPARIMY